MSARFYKNQTDYLEQLNAMDEAFQTAVPATKLSQLQLDIVLDPAHGGTGANNGTNTLTLGGNLATAGAFASTFTMTSVTSVTFPTSGTLLSTAAAVTPAQGGTGLASYTAGDLLYASGAETLAKLADIATGNVLLSGGAGAAPSYGKVGLTTHVSGILPVASGGTGAATLTGITYGNGTGAFTAATAAQIASALDTQAIGGNAATATKLATAVTINGKSFDGSAGFTLTTTDLAEGTNLYYTNARVLATPLTGLSTATNSALAATDTNIVAFGKLQAQINAFQAASSGVSTVNNIAPVSGNVTLTTANIGENTNLYYTDARVRAAVLTGLSTATATAATAADSMLVAVGKLQAQASANATAISGKEPTIAAGTASQFWRGDKSWQTLDKTAVGLTNVDNTSDANKPVSTAQQTALNAKQDTSAKDASGGYVGKTGHSHNIKNAAGTVTSQIASTATAARTYTLPDKDGTVAMLSDIGGGGGFSNLVVLTTTQSFTFPAGITKAEITRIDGGNGGAGTGLPGSCGPAAQSIETVNPSVTYTATVGAAGGAGGGAGGATSFSGTGLTTLTSSNGAINWVSHGQYTVFADYGAGGNGTNIGAQQVGKAGAIILRY